MAFEWPIALWLLAAIPLLVAGYFYALNRRKKVALKFPSLGLVQEALGHARNSAGTYRPCSSCSP